MRVELSKALSILSHEMRGPLGVLQGYLRMLRDGVQDPAITARMLQSMQDAATRLTTLAREASDLSAWAEGRRAAGSERVPLARLLEQIVSDAGVTDAVQHVAEDLADETVYSEPPGALARALATVLTAGRREAPGVPFALTVRRGHAAGELVVLMGPAASSHADAPATPAPFEFDRGGLGLSLVLASHVLDLHGARLTTASDDRSRMTVCLQQEGGSP